MSAPTQVSSGIGTISGVIRVNALPVALFRGLSGAEGAYSDYSGSINVNISGGTINVSASGNVIQVSGQYLNVAASGVGISHFSGALNVNISGGTITSNVSGNVVVIASGFGAISGVQVVISGGAFSSNISGGVIVSGGVQVSGSILQQVRNSGGIITDVGITSGVATMWMPVGSMSGASVIVSGVVGANVSGSLQISGTVAVSGQVIITSGGTIPVAVLSGAQNISGGVTISGGITISGGVQISGRAVIQVLSSGNTIVSVGIASGVADGSHYLPIASASGEALRVSGVVGATISGGVTVSGGVQVSGFVGALSGGTLPIAKLSGFFVQGSGGNLITDFSGALNVNISGGSVITNISGNVVNISGQFVTIMSGGTIPISVVSGDAFATSQKLVSGLVTITSGTTILLGIIPLALSGGSPTYSGQTLIISNAISGMDSYLSGTPFFFFDFGLHSGLVNGLPPIIRPIIISAPIICLSGLVANTSGGQWNLTVLYRQ